MIAFMIGTNSECPQFYVDKMYAKRYSICNILDMSILRKENL